MLWTAPGALGGAVVLLARADVVDGWPNRVAIVAAGAAAGAAVALFQEGLRPGRLTGLTPAFAVFAATALGLGAAAPLAEAPDWFTAVMLLVGVATIAIAQAAAVPSILPIIGTALFGSAAAIVSFPQSLWWLEGPLDNGQAEVILVAGLLGALGFLISEFSGSRGWYFMLIAGLTVSAAALVGSIELVERSAIEAGTGTGTGTGLTIGSFLDDNWFLSSLLLAYGTAVALLAWRVLTWGWFLFIGLSGAATVLILASNGAENERRIGVLLLVLVFVAGAATSFSKVTFRAVASAAVGVLLLAAILEGLEAGSRAEAQADQRERARLEATQIRVVGIHNCIADLIAQARPSDEDYRIERRTVVTEIDGETVEEIRIPDDDPQSFSGASCAERSPAEREPIDTDLACRLTPQAGDNPDCPTETEGPADVDGALAGEPGRENSEEPPDAATVTLRLAAASILSPLTDALQTIDAETIPTTTTTSTSTSTSTTTTIPTSTTAASIPTSTRSGDGTEAATATTTASGTTTTTTTTTTTSTTATVEVGPVERELVSSKLTAADALAYSVRLRRIELSLIDLELDLSGGPEVATRVTDARTVATEALDRIETLLEAERSRSSNLRELVVAGADNAAANLLPGSENNDDIRLGPYGWLAIGLLLLFGYRRAEIANNRRTSAPIVIEEPVLGDGIDEATGTFIKATIEADLSRAGIEEPAALPASGLASELVELVQSDSLQGSKWVAGTLKAIRGIGFPPGGITVRPTVSTENGLTRVNVWVHTTRTRTPLYTQTFANDEPLQAARQAAFFVARAALNYSRNVPRWARWHSEDGIGFRVFHETLTRQLDEPPLDEPRKKRDNLLLALAASPATSQLNVELGYLYDLDMQLTISLRHHLTARAQTPRFLVAGYRVVGSASMISADVERYWRDGAERDWEAIATLLTEARLLQRASRTTLWRRAGLHRLERRGRETATEAAARRLRRPDRQAGPGELGEVQRILLCVAWVEISRLRRSVSLPIILRYAAFQSERRYWLRFLRDAEHRRQTGDHYEVARLTVELRLELAIARRSASQPLDAPTMQPQPVDARAVQHCRALQRRVDAIVDRRHVGGLALYTAACFYSQLSAELSLHEDATPSVEMARSRAVHLLRRSRRGGIGTNPSSRWILTDPDLEPLTGHPAYDELRRALSDGDRELGEARKAT